MNAVILSGVPDARHVAEFLSPIDLKDGSTLRENMGLERPKSLYLSH